MVAIIIIFIIITIIFIKYKRDTMKMMEEIYYPISLFYRNYLIHEIDVFLILSCQDMANLLLLSIIMIWHFNYNLCQ